MKKLLCLLLIGCFAALLVTGCSSEKKDNTQDTSEESSATEAAPTEAEPEKPSQEAFEIETAYATLKYPETLKEKVKVTESDNTVSFSSGKTKLFDLIFDGDEGELLGTLVNDGKYTVVCIKQYSIDKEAENYTELSEMIGSIDVLLDYLAYDYDFVKGEIVDAEDDESVFEIETSLTSLYYPQKWKDKVTVAVEDQLVSFSSGDVKLFDLHFGGDKGDVLGFYKDTEIRVVLYDVEKGKLSDKEYSELLGMKDGINVIIDYLAKDKNFSIG